METLTLQQSTIRGTVLGKAVFCTLRGSPAGLQLAAGSYLLQPPQNNPVYGLVMVIEPLTRAAEAATSAFDSFRKAQATAPGKIALGPPANPSAVKLTEPAAHKATDPAAVKFTSPSAVKITDPSAVKFTDPSAVKMTDPAAIKFADPAGVKFTDPSAVKYSEPSAVKFTGAAAHKFTDPSTVKYGPAAAVATLGLPQGAPAIKFDTAAGQVNQPIVISERSIAGNSFQATAGFGDLVEVVQRAGAVKLVVV